MEQLTVDTLRARARAVLESVADIPRRQRELVLETAVLISRESEYLGRAAALDREEAAAAAGGGTRNG